MATKAIWMETKVMTFMGATRHVSWSVFESANGWHLEIWTISDPFTPQYWSKYALYGHDCGRKLINMLYTCFFYILSAHYVFIFGWLGLRKQLDNGTHNWMTDEKKKIE